MDGSGAISPNMVQIPRVPVSQLAWLPKKQHKADASMQLSSTGGCSLRAKAWAKVRDPRCSQGSLHRADSSVCLEGGGKGVRRCSQAQSQARGTRCWSQSQPHSLRQTERLGSPCNYAPRPRRQPLGWDFNPSQEVGGLSVTPLPKVLPYTAPHLHPLPRVWPVRGLPGSVHSFLGSGPGSRWPPGYF